MLAVCFKFHLTMFPRLYGPNVRIILNEKFVRAQRERALAYFKAVYRICLEILRSTSLNLIITKNQTWTWWIRNMRFNHSIRYSIITIRILLSPFRTWSPGWTSRCVVTWHAPCRCSVGQHAFQHHVVRSTPSSPPSTTEKSLVRSSLTTSSNSVVVLSDPSATCFVHLSQWLPVRAYFRSYCQRLTSFHIN
jgi:hypothetical protein